jgi:2-hydroxychromene-2-carboxylate isomerase
MRAAYVALEHGKCPAWSRAVFEAYWRDDRDIADPAVLADLADGVGLFRDELVEKIAEPEYKERLRKTTDELVARGGFGSPTMIVDDDDLYFGNDRIPLVRAALERSRR